MPQTLFDRIWDAHFVGKRSDGRDLVYMDRHVLHELHAPHAFAKLRETGRGVPRPDLTFACQDHTVPSRTGRFEGPDRSGSVFNQGMREGTREFGIRLFDIDDPEQGISHVVAPELGIVQPGGTYACPDSHACTVGGLGVLAFACGTSELEHVLATQVRALKKPKRRRIGMEGRLSPGVTAKDVILRVIAECGVDGGRGHAVEYAGAVARALPIEGRLTLCNMAIEMGARNGFIAPDDATFGWLAGRPWMPTGKRWDEALAWWRTLKSDDDAVFDREVTREAAQWVLSDAPGVVLNDEPERGEFPTPADVVGTDPTWVGRVRRSLDDPRAVDLFVCGDNLRKGAALNTAQIAELVAAEFAAR